MSPVPKALLRWYDKNARALPWRAPPGSAMRPDPYRVWLSEVMLQQTTVAAVAPRYQRFLARWPGVAAMAAAPLEDVLGEWAGLGYYARARNLHKCAVAVAARGRFPDNEEALRALPGVGDYTAAAIAAIAFDRPAVVMDGNIERVAARLFAIATPPPKAKAELKAAIGAIWPKKRSGDFAQGLMDLGAAICTPRAPKCLLCPLTEHCEGSAQGIAEALPAKAKKAVKPLRRGTAYALFNGRGEVLFERRPEKGLLGGMLGLPGTAWTSAPSPPPCGEVEIREANFGWGNVLAATSALRSKRGDPHPKRSSKVSAAPQGGGEGSAPLIWRCAGTVTHSFTHFHLELDVMTAIAPKGFRKAACQQWIAPGNARLPTVMKKATVLAAANGKKAT